MHKKTPSCGVGILGKIPFKSGLSFLHGYGEYDTEHGFGRNPFLNQGYHFYRWSGNIQQSRVQEVAIPFKSGLSFLPRKTLNTLKSTNTSQSLLNQGYHFYEIETLNSRIAKTQVAIPFKSGLSFLQCEGEKICFGITD